MFRRFTQTSLLHLRLNCRSLTTSASSQQPKACKWDLYSGVLLERLPIVSKTLNLQERKFQDTLWRIEFENSLKSDHELQHERELVQAELVKKGKIEIDLDDSSSKQTMQDLQDAYVEELKKFQFAPRTTADDLANNTTSTNRCLEDTLYLLVEHKLGEKTYLLLPQGPRLEGETMRQTAERVLREKCGDHLQAQFYGNAPCGFYKFKYPTTMRAQSVGAKVFFYRATLQSGNSNKTTNLGKFEWLSKTELNGKLTNATYAESVLKLLL